jgi:hypothetical protein
MLYKDKIHVENFSDEDLDLWYNLGWDTKRGRSLPSSYDLDDLSKNKYKKIRREDYRKDPYDDMDNDKGVSPPPKLGVYGYSEDKVILDLNAIKRTAEQRGYDFEKLREIVLYHEIGHHLTRFGEWRDNANNKNWMNSLYYQELIAQLTAYHCMNNDNGDGRFVMEDLSKHQEEAYCSYLAPEFEIFRSNPDDMFKLIFSINAKQIQTINSLEVLKKVIGKVKLKTEEVILNEFRYDPL